MENPLEENVAVLRVKTAGSHFGSVYFPAGRELAAVWELYFFESNAFKGAVTGTLICARIGD